MSAISARTEMRVPKFSNAWRTDGTGAILSIVDLGNNDAYLTFNSAAHARAVAAECIKAAEAMEQLGPG